MPQGPTLTVDGKRTTIHYFTGKVLSSQKQKETQIYSQSYGTQNNPQVSVGSTTVDHHEFFLADSSGTERAFKTVDFDIPCREGNTMTVMWAIPEDVQEGPFIEVRNHNTGEHKVIEPKRIASYYKKPAWMIWGSAIGAAIVLGAIGGWFIGLLAFCAPFVYFTWRARSAAKKLLSSSEFRQLDSQVAQLKPVAA